MPIDPRRRDEIAAAVAAYDRDHPDAPLPRNAARLLTVMFPSEDVCQRSLEDHCRGRVQPEEASCALRRLVEAGFLSKAPGSGAWPHTYRLHLPPVRP